METEDFVDDETIKRLFEAFARTCEAFGMTVKVNGKQIEE
jgi:hypothetical protein